MFEALSFINRYRVKIEFINSDTFEKLKLLVKYNYSIIKDFLMV